MNQRLARGLTVARSKIHGKGCFAAILFHESQQIAEYVGERISMAEAERRRCAPAEQCICDVDTEWAIDGSRGGQRHTIHQSFVPAERICDCFAGADLSPRPQRDPSRRRDHDRLPVRTEFGRDALQLPDALLSGNDEPRWDYRGLCGAGEREARPSTSIPNAPLGRRL
jgi:hypothetical protein